MRMHYFIQGTPLFTSSLGLVRSSYFCLKDIMFQPYSDKEVGKLVKIILKYILREIISILFTTVTKEASKMSA
jgi:hypothetical protein